MKSLNKEIKIHIIVIALLSIIIALVFSKSWVPEFTLASGDASLSTLAAHYRSLPQGYIARWSPHGGLGHLATPVGISPGFLLAHVVPFSKFADANYIMHLLLLGIFSYFLLVDITKNKFAGFIGSLWMMLQPHVLSHALPGHLGHFLMIGWIPGIFLFLRKAVRTNKITYWGLTGAFLGAAISAGTHDVMGFFGIMIFAYGIYLLLHKLITIYKEKQSLKLPTFLRICSGILVAIFLSITIGYQAIFINLLQLLNSEDQIQSCVPALVQQDSSPRQKWLWATQWSFPVEEVLDCAIPGLFGWGSSNQQNPYRGRIGQTEGFPEHKTGLPNLNDLSQYIGAVMMLACLMAIVMERRNPDLWFFLIASIAGLFLSFGKYAPFYRVFYLLPKMASIRCPVKWFYITSFCIGIMGTMGIAAVDRRSRLSDKPVSHIKIAVSIVVPVFVVFISGYILIGIKKTIGDLFWKNPQLVQLSISSIKLGMAFWIVAGVAFYIWLRQSKVLPGKSYICLLPKLLLVVCLLCEIIYVDKHYLPYRKISQITQGGAFADFLNRQKRPFRIKFLKFDGVFGYLRNNLPGLYNWELADPPVSRSLDDFTILLRTFGAFPEKMLQLCGVRYLIAEGEIKSDFLKPVLKLNAGNVPVVIYQFTKELPRYFLVTNWKSVFDIKKHYNIMTDPTFLIGKNVLIQADTIPFPSSVKPSILSCKINFYEWYKIVLGTESDVDSMLVGLDRFNPSWHVYIDGKETELLRADGMLRACYVPAGKHEIILTLKGKGFMPIIITCTGWMMGIILGITAIISKKRSSSDITE